MSEIGTIWMRLCGYRLAGPIRWHGEAAKQLLAGELAARIWSQAGDADRVQHIRIRSADSPGPEPPEPDGSAHRCRLDVGILLMADSDDKARAVGARLCTGALAAGPDTVGWTLQPLI
ncbi:hypothetical protein [Actinoplanes lobatus]|uniref:Uncharacterized protein n=1 Tax=Actinoplanes lobatus TaxID=113568 RepID=A0A7W7HR26_9ACTN|nr:hypothetical protein [Actinoplanes lobatus]MBB4755039.1 hypothetical protein [Actinoplanes lobatus]